MDTKAIKPEDNKGGTFTAQITAEEVTSASITPVPAQAPGIIWAEPGTVKEEAIYYKTRDAEAGTIGGLTRDFTNLNGGTGQQHENSADWEVLQSSKIIENLIDIVTEGYIQEQNTIARVDDTSFTIAGNVSAVYNAGRTIRFNQDNAELVTVVSATYAAGTGLTTIVITDDTIPATLTTAEYSIQPKGVGLVSLTGSQTLTNKTLTSPVINTGVLGTAIKDEDTMASDSATALATQQSIKAAIGGGWLALGYTLTYASADSPTFTATVAGEDLTSVISPGMRMRVSQSTGGTKYFIVTAVAFSTNTTITLYGGTDYTLNSEAISSPVFSSVKAPVGFPLDPRKWTTELRDTSNRSQATPNNATFYNLGSLSLAVPIGSWNLEFKCLYEIVENGTSLTDQIGVSTSNSSFSDKDLVQYPIFIGATSAALQLNMPIWIQKSITITSKTTHYVLARNYGTPTSIALRGDEIPTIVRAVSAYL